MRHMAFLVVIITALMAIAPAGATEEVSDHDRFALWNYCAPMDLVVVDLSGDATDIGLTKDAVTVAVRSKLRAARLYSAGSRVPLLAANAHVVSTALNIRVQYFKWLYDPMSDLWREANTWVTSSTGTHRGEASYILSAVSQHVDEFIDDYLRVNGPAC